MGLAYKVRNDYVHGSQSSENRKGNIEKQHLYSVVRSKDERNLILRELGEREFDSERHCS